MQEIHERTETYELIMELIWTRWTRWTRLTDVSQKDDILTMMMPT